MDDTNTVRVPDGTGLSQVETSSSGSLAPSGFDPSRIAVGDRLWFEPSQKYGRATWVKVEKVGRKWATLGPDGSGYFSGRVEIGSRALDGGGYGSTGRLYASPEEREQERRVDELWKHLRDFTQRSFRRPEHLTGEKLGGILAILRDSDGSPSGRDREAGLDGEAATARAEGIAQ